MAGRERLRQERQEGRRRRESVSVSRSGVVCGPSVFPGIRLMIRPTITSVTPGTDTTLTAPGTDTD